MAYNLKALFYDQVCEINKIFTFDIIGENVLVSTLDGSRRVLHSIHKPFKLVTPYRKITISERAINLWALKFKDNYSLIEVQNAINILIITKQKDELNDIAKQLKRGDAKIIIK